MGIFIVSVTPVLSIIVIKGRFTLSFQGDRSHESDLSDPSFHARPLRKPSLTENQEPPKADRSAAENTRTVTKKKKAKKKPHRFRGPDPESDAVFTFEVLRRQRAAAGQGHRQNQAVRRKARRTAQIFSDRSAQTARASKSKAWTRSADGSRNGGSDAQKPVRRSRRPVLGLSYNTTCVEDPEANASSIIEHARASTESWRKRLADFQPSPFCAFSVENG